MIKQNNNKRNFQQTIDDNNLHGNKTLLRAFCMKVLPISWFGGVKGSCDRKYQVD